MRLNPVLRGLVEGSRTSNEARNEEKGGKEGWGKAEEETEEGEEVEGEEGK